MRKSADRVGGGWDRANVDRFDSLLHDRDGDERMVLRQRLDNGVPFPRRWENLAAQTEELRAGQSSSSSSKRRPKSTRGSFKGDLELLRGLEVKNNFMEQQQQFKICQKNAS